MMVFIISNMCCALYFVLFIEIEHDGVYYQ